MRCTIQKRFETLALVGVVVATVLSAAPAQAQEPISLDCRLAPAARSIQSTTPTSIQFVNETLGGVIDVSWIDFQGRPKTYATLQPGQSVVQQTFVSHPWVLTAANGTCLGLFLPTQQATRVVIRPEELVAQAPALGPQVRSREATTPTSIEFVNPSISIDVVVSWIDYQGKAQTYATLKPGQSYVAQTYLTHPWMLSTPDGFSLGIYLPTRRPGRVQIAVGRG
jgi:hypothetical protein